MRILISTLICIAIVIPASASPLSPSIANSGFEEVAQGNDAPGWGWYARARASFHSETQDPHSGKRCLVFTNESDLEPEVYGRLFQGVVLLPDTEYVLSVWVRGEDVASGIHFTDWNSYQLDLPSGTYGWRQVSKTFRTRPEQHDLNLGINVVNRCKALAIDDISLRPIGIPLKGDGVSGSFLAPGQVRGDDNPAFLQIELTSSRAGSVSAAIKVDGRTVAEKAWPLNPAENSIEWQWNTGKLPVRRMSCVVRVLDEKGEVIASGAKEIQKLSASVISADLDRIEARLEEFDSLHQKCRVKGIPLDYPSVTRTMLTQFIPLERVDLRKGELRRADFAVKDFDRSLDTAIAEMQTYLRNPKSAPNAVRYRTGDIEIDNTSFVGNRQDTKGVTSRGPVFFCGYGHFYQVRRDMFRWPGYGVNIIQIEIGPRITMPTEDEIDLKAARGIVRVLDEAAKKNVMVNILLSPHYFPDWAMQKWPHLAKGGGGFLGFCVDAPEAKQVIEKFLRTVVPLFKDKPALHSFCLSNEPLFDRSQGTDNAKPMWREYLARVHGDVQTMNVRYGTSYASFDDVPMPGNGDYGAPQFYDYCVLNHERFAGWHKWMADVIHEMAPEVPVHAKVMAWTFFQRNTIGWGTSAEMFGEFGQINGNDCAMWPGGGEWATSWHGQNMAYDLQRSLNPQPIFNSENHLTPDGSTYYVAPEHFRTALWQGAIHGQGATTIWVWERALDPKHPHYAHTACFYGNVMDRPGCAEAVGRTCLDLNRFAEEVTALQRKHSPVAILYSVTSIARNQRHLEALGRVYTALSFVGVKVDFVSEKQLAEGKGLKYSMIVLPEATHMPRKTHEKIQLLPASCRLVIVGAGPEKDPYGEEIKGVYPMKPESGITRFAGDADVEKVLWPQLSALLSKLGALPSVRLVDANTGQPVWGVEWRPAQVGNRIVMNIVNLTSTPVDVKIVRNGKTVAANDLLSVGGTAEVGRLIPIAPVLAEVTR